MQTPLLTSNNRGSVRRRVLKGARIILGDSLGTIPCTIRDLSSSGCRIQLERATVLPGHFTLLSELDGLEFVCLPVWRSGITVGIAFEGSARLVRPTRSQVVSVGVKR